jgi:hypothetical protein
MGEGPVGKGTSERQMNDRSRQGHATPHVHFESGSVSCSSRIEPISRRSTASSGELPMSQR